MTFLTKIFPLLPLLFLVTEIVFLSYYRSDPTLTPVSSKNNFTREISSLLHTAQITPLNFVDRDYQNEVEFYFKNRSGQTYGVVFSSQKNALFQVAALQKVIKIANIKGTDIHFIDLSVKSPYATL